MAIAAHLDETPQAGGRARELRRRLRLEAQGVAGSGEPANVLVHNISATGLLLETEAALAEGARIELDLPQAGATAASVVWVSGHFYGCRFDTAISAATLSAAQLRSPVEEEAASDAALPGSGEAFGARLQRLRRERGLTMAQLAGQLGVSKPTVWAWEQGKARPVAGRLEALAAALGVDRGQLVGGRDGAPVGDVVARARAQIAAALGGDIERIHIWVEL